MQCATYEFINSMNIHIQGGHLDTLKLTIYRRYIWFSPGFMILIFTVPCAGLYRFMGKEELVFFVFFNTAVSRIINLFLFHRFYLVNLSLQKLQIQTVQKTCKNIQNGWKILKFGIYIIKGIKTFHSRPKCSFLLYYGGEWRYSRKNQESVPPITFSWLIIDNRGQTPTWVNGWGCNCRS